jgi:hypothetical protein
MSLPPSSEQKPPPPPPPPVTCLIPVSLPVLVFDRTKTQGKFFLVSHLIWAKSLAGDN